MDTAVMSVVRPLKEVVAELTLENRLLKKRMTADGRSNRGKRLRREDAA